MLQARRMGRLGLAGLSSSERVIRVPKPSLLMTSMWL